MTASPQLRQVVNQAQSIIAKVEAEGRRRQTERDTIDKLSCAPRSSR